MTTLFHTLYLLTGEAAVKTASFLGFDSPAGEGGPRAEQGVADLFTIDVRPALEVVEGGSLGGKSLEDSEVKAWIESEEEKLRKRGGTPTTVEEAARLTAGYKALQAVKTLRGLRGNIQRWDVLHLCRDIEVRMFEAAKTGDQKGIEEGFAALPKIVAYAQAEKRMFSTMKGLASQYPAGSRFLLQLDLTKDNPRIAPYLSGEKELSPWEQSLDQVRQRPVVQLYGQLKGSASGERREAAQAVRTAVDEFTREAGFFSGSWADVAGRFGMKPMSLKALEERTNHLEEVYASPKLAEFFDLLKKQADEEVKANEGFQTREGFKKASAALEDIHVYDAVLSRPYEEIADRLDARMLDDTRKFFIGRGEDYLSFLKKEEERFAREDEDDRPETAPVADPDGRGGFKDTEWVSPRVVEARDEIAKVEKHLGRLRALEIRGNDLRGPFEGLGKLSTRTYVLEAGHCEGLLKKLIAQAEAIPSSRGQLDGLKKELAAVGGGPAQRLKAYREVEVKVRSAVALRLVDASIEQYETFLDEGVLTEGIATVIGLPASVMSQLMFDRPVELASRGSVPSLRLNEEILDRLKTIRARLDSGDPRTETQGLQEFESLRSAGVHQTLASKFAGDATFNAFTIGLGIVLTSGMLAGAAATVAAPFVEGMAGEAVILYALQGTVFTLSHHVLDGAVRDRLGREIEKMAGDPLALAGECALNAAMFGYIGGAMKHFNRWFAKGLERVAERNVTQQLGRAVVAEDAALVKTEVARLSAQIETQALKSAGGFAFEAGVFQTWQFYVSVGRATERNISDPIGAVKKAAQQSFSGDAILHNVFFLLALKGGHHLSEPIFHPVLEKAHIFAMGKRFEKGWKSVQEEAAAVSSDLEAFYSEGKGDFGKLMERYQAALAKKWALLETVPTEFRNEAWEAQVRENRSSFVEVEGFKRFWAAMPKIARLSEARGDGVYSYAPHAREAFLRELKSLENTEVKILGDTIVAHFRFPGGIEVTRIFIPKTTVKGLPRAESGYQKQPYADAAE